MKKSVENTGTAIRYELPDEKFFDEYISAKKNALCDLIIEDRSDFVAALIDASVLEGSVLTEEEKFSEYHYISLREFYHRNNDDAPSAKRAKGLSVWHDTYRHCPKCGAKFKDDEIDTALLCTECSFKLFPRIEPCIIVLISRGDEVLLIKDKHTGARFYSCIAGFIELGETAAEAVRREVREEVGLEVKNIRPVGTQCWPFPDQLMIAYTADYESGEIHIQDEEIAEAKWFLRTSLPPKEELPGEGSVAWKLIFNEI